MDTLAVLPTSMCDDTEVEGGRAHDGVDVDDGAYLATVANVAAFASAYLEQQQQHQYQQQEQVNKGNERATDSSPLTDVIAGEVDPESAYAENIANTCNGGSFLTDASTFGISTNDDGTESNEHKSSVNENEVTSASYTHMSSTVSADGADFITPFVEMSSESKVESSESKLEDLDDKSEKRTRKKEDAIHALEFGVKSSPMSHDSDASKCGGDLASSKNASNDLNENEHSAEEESGKADGDDIGSATSSEEQQVIAKIAPHEKPLSMVLLNSTSDRVRTVHDGAESSADDAESWMAHIPTSAADLMPVPVPSSAYADNDAQESGSGGEGQGGNESESDVAGIDEGAGENDGTMLGVEGSRQQELDPMLAPPVRAVPAPPVEAERRFPIPTANVYPIPVPTDSPPFKGMDELGSSATASAGLSGANLGSREAMGSSCTDEEWLCLDENETESRHEINDDANRSNSSSPRAEAVRKGVATIRRSVGEANITRARRATSTASSSLASVSSQIREMVSRDSKPRASSFSSRGHQSPSSARQVIVGSDGPTMPRSYLPFQVHRNISTNLWVATIHTDQKALDSGKHAKAEREVVAFSFDTEKEAREAVLAFAPPRMLSFADSPVCFICLSKFGVFKRACHCRNCGVCICNKCATLWPAKAIPETYNIKDEANVKICKQCDWLSSAFRTALLSGRYDEAVALRATGNVNLRSPFANVKGETFYPIHCAALGGNVTLLRWLLDSHCCPVSAAPVRKHRKRGMPDQSPILTSKGRSLLDIAVSSQHVDMLRYLVVEKDVSVLGIKDFKTSLIMLDAVLRRLPPEPADHMAVPTTPGVPETARSSSSIHEHDEMEEPPEDFNKQTHQQRGSADSSVDDIAMLHLSQYEAMQASPSSTKSELHDEGAALNDASAGDECIICFEREIDCVITPCGHQICCLRCSSNLSQCPICNTTSNFVRIFKP